MAVPRKNLCVHLCENSTKPMVERVVQHLSNLGYPVSGESGYSSAAGIRVVSLLAGEFPHLGGEESHLLLCQPGQEREAACIADKFDDLLVWPAHERETRFRIDRLFEPAQSTAQPLARPERLPPWICGESQKFLETVNRVDRLAGFDIGVLITGETGAGKEVFARAIHYLGERASQPFIAINCGALPDALFENEMFGHAKGAYTDAKADSVGLVAAANGGTLFLDEIDALSPHGQAALLRFLQDGSYRIVGSDKTRKSDVRVIAATNADLQGQIEAGDFRNDLFYRLAGSQLNIPPLREREEDILILADLFLTECKDRLGGKAGEARITAELAGWLLAQHWPGNARELRSTIENLYVFSESDALLPPNEKQTCRRDQGRSLVEKRQCARDAFERQELLRLMRSSGGNVSSAARKAMAERKYFSRLLQKHEIDRSQFLS